MNTNHALRAPKYVGEVDASVADCWRVDEGGNFGHVREADFVEHVRVLVLEVRQINIFLEVLVF